MPSPLIHTMSPDLFYFLTFLTLSATIGLTPWPRCQRRWGIALGVLALIIASGLGWIVATSEHGWDSAIHDKLAGMLPDLEVSRDAAKTQGIDQTWNIQLTALRNLSPFLKGLLGFLAAYLAVRMMALALSWLWVVLRRLWVRWRPPVHPVCSGQLRMSSHDAHAFLRQVANGGLIVLGLFLAGIPWWVQYGDPLIGAALASPVANPHAAVREVTFVDPPLLSFFSTVVWMGIWVLLLELRFCLATFEPRTAWMGTDVSARPILSLEPLYRTYLDQYAPLLLFHGAQPPIRGELPAVPTTETDNPEAAAQRLQLFLHGLPDAALDTLLPPLRHAQSGGDVLFTETLSAHHLLLASLLIQHTRQSGATTLLIAPAAALEPLERALRQCLANYHLLLMQHWVVLGRDVLANDTLIDVLVCPAEELETRVLDQTALLADDLQRSRLVLCLECQQMEWSNLRWNLSRLWQYLPRERATLLVQAEGWYDMESQLRYLARFRKPLEWRLNPHLHTHRYLLVWDSDAPQQSARQQSTVFAHLQEPLELAPLLLIPAWRMGFPVAPRGAVERYNADVYEYLQNTLLPQHSEQALLPLAVPYQPQTYPVAVPPTPVFLVDDISNLPLALDYGAPVAEVSEVLLNVACGRYLLRDYYLDCLRGAAGEAGLPRHLRPLATRPCGTLPQLATALGAALRHGLRGKSIQQDFLDRAPAGLLPPELARANLPSLNRLFTCVWGAHAPLLHSHWDEHGEKVFSIAPEYVFNLQPRLPVVDEQGQILAFLPRSDHGLSYAASQYRLIQNKFHLIKTVGVQVRVHHEDDPHGRLRRSYVFHRRYTLGERQLSEGEGWVQQWAGNVSLRVTHWQGIFAGETLGFLEFAPEARPLASQPPEWSYTVLEGKNAINRECHWQNVACFELRHPALENAEARARLAFTFCAVWQESLPSLFPGQAYRLAVISPQATALPEPENDDDRFYRRLYPIWRGDSAPDEPVIQVYLLEDTDHDLGVVRAQVQSEGVRVTWALLRDYLHWAQQQPAERLYQAYGAAALPDCLDYAGVEELLNALTGTWTRPATPTSPVTTPGAALLPPATPSLTTPAIATNAPSPPPLQRIITDIKPPAVCDFCAAPLGSGSVTLDGDHRQRCYHCDQEAIDTLGAFRRLWDEVVEGMEGRYECILPDIVQVRFASAADLAQQIGKPFQPTLDYDRRAVGLLVPAECDTPTLWLENGAPRLSVMEALVREQVHLWQAHLGIRCHPCPVELIEGQALYTVIDYLAVQGGEALAAYRHRQAETGDSPAARGYRRIAPQCPVDPQKLFEHFRRLLAEARQSH